MAINRAAITKSKFIGGAVGHTVDFKLLDPLINTLLTHVIPYVNTNFLAGKAIPLTFNFKHMGIINTEISFEDGYIQIFGDVIYDPE